MEKQAESPRKRSQQFALRVIRMVRSFPRTPEADVMGRQILRSATAVAADYRAAGRGRSKAEFIAKIGIVVEEAEETVFWLEMLLESGTVKREQMEALLKEANELLAIFAASYRTARRKRSKSPDDPMAR